MIRDTSIEAFHKIKDEGLLSEKRWQVYEVLFQYGPLTGNELLIHLRKKYQGMLGNAPSVVSRLGELRDMGSVREIGKKICSVTGMTVINWDVTAKLPIKLERVEKIKCKHCDGTGEVTQQQARLFK